MENMDFLPPSAPNLVSKRETYMAYCLKIKSIWLIENVDLFKSTKYYKQLKVCIFKRKVTIVCIIIVLKQSLNCNQSCQKW